MIERLFKQYARAKRYAHFGVSIATAGAAHVCRGRILWCWIREVLPLLYRGRKSKSALSLLPLPTATTRLSLSCPDGGGCRFAPRRHFCARDAIQPNDVSTPPPPARALYIYIYTRCIAKPPRPPIQLYVYANETFAFYYRDIIS